MRGLRRLIASFTRRILALMLKNWPSIYTRYVKLAEIVSFQFFNFVFSFLGWKGLFIVFAISRLEVGVHVSSHGKDGGCSTDV